MHRKCFHLKTMPEMKEKMRGGGLEAQYQTELDMCQLSP